MSDRRETVAVLLFVGFPVLFLYLLGVDNAISRRQQAKLFHPASDRVFDLTLAPNLDPRSEQVALWVPFRRPKYYQEVESVYEAETLSERTESRRLMEEDFDAWLEKSRAETAVVLEQFGTDESWRESTDMDFFWRFDVEADEILPESLSYMRGKDGVTTVDATMVTWDGESPIRVEILREALLFTERSAYEFDQHGF